MHLIIAFALRILSLQGFAWPCNNQICITGKPKSCMGSSHAELVQIQTEASVCLAHCALTRRTVARQELQRLALNADLEGFQLALILCKEQAHISQGGDSTPLTPQGNRHGLCLQLPIFFLVSWSAGFCCRCTCDISFMSWITRLVLW